MEQASVASREIGLAEAAVAVDVASEESVDAMASIVASRLGGLDVLVHCAGIGFARTAMDTSLADWRGVLDVNLTGTFLCCRAAGRLMTAQGSGSMIAIGSSAATLPSAGRAAYSASKAGVLNLIRSLALELAPSGIRVNAISPGPIETELVAATHTAEIRHEFKSQTPMGRYGSPGEVAGAALFLASDEASYVTGHNLAVDGGFTTSGVIGSSAGRR